jgi:hypothetical protein
MATDNNDWRKNGLGKKDSNLRMPESKSGALTSLATPHLTNHLPSTLTGARHNHHKQTIA